MSTVTGAGERASEPTRVVIVGAAGRDFHNFNVVYRDDPRYRVVAFTATQIPGVDDRRYPADLARAQYPEGIPIVPEKRLRSLVSEESVDEVVFAYSDITYGHVMERASISCAAGADYRLLGPRSTMIKSNKPVISICAVRTGCGKSPTTRRVLSLLKERELRAVVVRHPMPYGDLSRQKVQRFGSLEDLDVHECTIEEREEYEAHIVAGSTVFAGADYGGVLAAAEAEADVVVWDGGNNDLPFFKPDLHIVVADAHRPGHERSYWPGGANLRMADVVILNKVDTASAENVAAERANIEEFAPDAQLILAGCPVTVDAPDKISGKRVLVVEDGPTLTHGGMKFGAGVVAAERYGAAEVVDPRPFVVGSMAATFEAYPDIGKVLPAMGYGQAQIADLCETIRRSDVDLVVVATPTDLTRLMDIDKPWVRVTYDLAEDPAGLQLSDVLDGWITERGVKSGGDKP